MREIDKAAHIVIVLLALADEYGGNGTRTPAGEPVEPNVTRDTNRAKNKMAGAHSRNDSDAVGVRSRLHRLHASDHPASA